MPSEIRKLVLALSIVFSCSAACAGVLSSEKKEMIPLPPAEAVTLTYRAVDSLNVAYPGSVVLQVAQRVHDASGMQQRATVRPDGKKLLFGLRTSYLADKHDLKLYYEAHEVSTNGLVLGQTIVITVHMEETSEDGRHVVNVTFPTEAGSATKKLFLFEAPQLSTDQVLADYALLVTAIQHAEVNVQTHLSGELDSKYRPDAVLANFDRLIGREHNGLGASRTETSLADRFVFRGKEFNSAISVTAFPYRDGSKVQYSAYVPLKLQPDGTAVGDDRAKALQELVAKVVND